MRVIRHVDGVGPVQRQLDQVLVALRALEWVGDTCPACHAAREDGHARGCTTSIALGQPPEVRGGGWLASVHLVRVGDLLDPSVRLLDSRRQAVEALRVRDVAGGWVARVQRRRGLPRLVLQVDEVRWPGSQRVLFAVTCEACGEAWHPAVKGPKARKCDRCREKRRVEYFASQQSRSRHV